MAEMQRRLHSDDAVDSWDDLTYLAYSMQERATRLLTQEFGSADSHDPRRPVDQAAQVMLGVSTAEFYLAIGQAQLAGREAIKAIRIVDRWSVTVGLADAIEANWRQLLHSPPAATVLSVEQAKSRLKQIMEQAYREL